MKYYTVKEIADIMGTNPETVRRWIRDKKLLANQDSRKDGNVISSQDLSKFLEKTPKYAGIVASGLATSVVSAGIGLSLITATAVLERLILDKKGEEKLKISSEKIAEYIMNCITESENSVMQKKKHIQKLQKEIGTEEQQINEYKQALKKINIIADTINASTTI